ncbi:lipopolysaccharide transport periplasmic protein LptA [Methylomagnum sp.]
MMFNRKNNRQAPGRRLSRAPLFGAFPSVALALLCALAPQPVLALDSDSKQPMYIESDTATYDEKKGETVYTGSVKATQGSLEAVGDKMIMYQVNGKTDKIVIWGNPTKIKQTPEGGKEDTHGKGQRAEYFPDTGILILYEKAMTWEGPDPAKSEHLVTSERIEYDTRNALYKAGGSHSGGKRVHVTILPKEDESE